MKRFTRMFLILALLASPCRVLLARVSQPTRSSPGRPEDLLRLPGPRDRVLGRWPQGHHRDAARAGHRSVRVNANEDANRQLEQVSDCIAQGVDGIIIIPQDGDSAVTIIGEAQAADIPIAVFNRPP